MMNSNSHSHSESKHHSPSFIGGGGGGGGGGSKKRRSYSVGMIFLFAGCARSFFQDINMLLLAHSMASEEGHGPAGEVPFWVPHPQIVSSSSSTSTKQQQQHNPPMDILDELTELSGGKNKDDELKLECLPPLIYFHDKLVRTTAFTSNINSSNNNDDNNTANNNATLSSWNTTKQKKNRHSKNQHNNNHNHNHNHNTRLIPQILHFSMKSRCIPQDIAMFLDRWKEQFPNYSIIFHDDDAVQRLLQQDWLEFPDLHRALQCVQHKGAMVIDVWRVLILYKYGGLYSDIDNWPTDAFTESVIDSTDSAFFASDIDNRPSQWLMASEPRHPLLYMTMYTIIQNLFNLRNLAHPKIVQVTGPIALRNAYFQFLDTDTNRKNNLDYYSDGAHIGLYGKIIHKVKYKRKLSNKLILLKYKYDDIVPYNSTLNVTREQRISMESGVDHWIKALQHRNKIGDFKNINLSCKLYLKQHQEQKKVNTEDKINS